MLYRARSLTELGQVNEAEPAIEAYVTAHPASPEGWRELDTSGFRLRKPTGSLDAYAQAAKLSPQTSTDLVISAQDYLLTMDTLSAAQCLEKALKLQPNDIEAVYQFGRVRYKQGRMDEAIASFEHVLRSDPSRIKAQENLGLCLERYGQLEQALAAYQQAVNLDAVASAHSDRPYLYLGALLVKLGRSQDAVPVLVRGLKELNPNSGKLHSVLGRAYLNLNRPAEAQHEMEESVQLDPKDGPSHYALARLYTSVGKPNWRSNSSRRHKSSSTRRRPRATPWAWGARWNSRRNSWRQPRTNRICQSPFAARESTWHVICLITRELLRQVISNPRV